MVQSQSRSGNDPDHFVYVPEYSDELLKMVIDVYKEDIQPYVNELKLSKMIDLIEIAEFCYEKYLKHLSEKQFNLCLQSDIIGLFYIYLIIPSSIQFQIKNKNYEIFITLKQLFENQLNMSNVKLQVISYIDYLNKSKKLSKILPNSSISRSRSKTLPNIIPTKSVSNTDSASIKSSSSSANSETIETELWEAPDLQPNDQLQLASTLSNESLDMIPPLPPKHSNTSPALLPRKRNDSENNISVHHLSNLDFNSDFDKLNINEHANDVDRHLEQSNYETIMNTRQSHRKDSYHSVYAYNEDEPIEIPTITSKQLFQELNASNYSYLMFDLRPKKRFERLHLQYPNIINIDPSLIISSEDFQSLKDVLKISLSPEEYSKISNLKKFDKILSYSDSKTYIQSNIDYITKFTHFLEYSNVDIRTLIGGIDSWNRFLSKQNIKSSDLNFKIKTPSIPYTGQSTQPPTAPLPPLPSAPPPNLPVASKPSIPPVSPPTEPSTSSDIPPIPNGLSRQPLFNQAVPYPESTNSRSDIQLNNTSAYNAYQAQPYNSQLSISRPATFNDFSHQHYNRPPYPQPEQHFHQQYYSQPHQHLQQYQHQHHRHIKPYPATHEQLENQKINDINIPTIQSSPEIFVRLSVTGLRNFGNTCYINSMIQCLFANKQFSQIFLENKYLEFFSQDYKQDQKLSPSIALLFKKMFLNGGCSIVPSGFLKVCSKIRSDFHIPTEQQDTQEFLMFMIDQLHTELCNSSAVVNEYPELLHPEGQGKEYDEFFDGLIKQKFSPISKIFQGQTQNVLECLNCGNKSNSYSTFFMLSLNIAKLSKNGKKLKKTFLEDCINLFIEDEVLQGDNAWKCPKCTPQSSTSLSSLVPENNNTFERETHRRKLHLLKFGRGRSSSPKNPSSRSSSKVKNLKTVKSLKFMLLPPVLIIHLSRFLFYDTSQKDETIIHYPLILHIVEKNKVIKYKLFALINHNGSLKSGHYTSIANKNKTHDLYHPNWYYFDDENVKTTEHGKLFENHTNDYIGSSEVYVLFYERVD